MPTYSDAYLALMGQAPRRIPHWEHLSNPDFVQLATGIDPWEKPRSAMLRLLEVYKIDLGCGAPPNDTPMPKLSDDVSSETGEDGRARVRWGTGLTGHWEWGENFKTIEEVLAYDPLEHLDMREMEVIEKRDYSLDDDAFYQAYYGCNWPETDESGAIHAIGTGFYNTLFMWPLLTFGWELFLELAGGYPEETKRIMGAFAEINRKVFRAIARTPEQCRMVTCHDDICMTAGPVCSPKWLREYIYPHYEEYWSMLKAAGKKVVFMSDGNIDKVADDIAACGADGFISEPYTDWKAIARKYPNHLVAGEGDNRTLTRSNPDEIRAMVDSMVETAKICNGYFMCVGNHIPWNVPAESVKLYFDYCAEAAHR